MEDVATDDLLVNQAGKRHSVSKIFARSLGVGMSGTSATNSGSVA